jgi:hypothetical protein
LALVLAGLLVSLAMSTVWASGRSGDLSTSPAEEMNAAHFPVVMNQRPVSAAPVYGINFISEAEHLADEQQYANAVSTGAAWNRFPLYWFFIEQSPNSFNWSNQDAAVAGDVAHGLKTDAILLGTPSFYTTLQPEDIDLSRPDRKGPFAMDAAAAAAPEGLYEPIFTDGTDLPGPGKQINSANVWARFVYLAVQRYKPGGTLAQANGWPADAGVTHWEIWNEPDLPWFWDSSLPDYARLLKVAYLTIRQADSSAKVMVGGLANFLQPNYYQGILEIYDSDSLAPPFNYFHDILATHNYFQSWESWYYVYSARLDMLSRGFDKPVWLNETGVAVWNDYPGPIWDPHSAFRATMGEQADFIIQSAFFAIFAGADAIFHFQLYDACGNQPPGTDFPPHNGELCGDPNYPICAGDANGLFRNPTDAVCYTQHPQPETPRPSYGAYRILTEQVNNVVPLWRKRPGGTTPYNGPQEWVALYRPHTQERLVAMWSRVGIAQTAVITATSSSAQLLWPNGTIQTITPQNGFYTIELPPATNDNDPPEWGWDPTMFAIGGRPAILIEVDPNPPAAAPPEFEPLVQTAVLRP